MKIGIVIAMDKEFQRIRSLLDEEKVIIFYGQKFVEGLLGRNDIIMMQSGVGKVNAAVSTTLLIENFKPDVVVATGVAGGASTQLNVQEVVVSSETCYHDVYCGKEVAYGQVQGYPARYNADKTLLEIASRLDTETKITSGLVVTGDRFVDTCEQMTNILQHFPDALAVDMESAAIAQVCFRLKTKFISFRIISDIPLKQNNTEQYNDFWERMANHSFDVTKKFLQAI